MKHILCYGDSNTWGFIPGSGRRYDESTRWTGVLQTLLGPQWRVHEDGLNARTTIFDEATKPFLNGLAALPGVLQAQKPLDVLIISLGTNDLKHHKAYHTAAGIARLILTAQTMDALYPSSEPVFRDKPRILVISPIAVGEMPREAVQWDDLAGKHEESLRFAQTIRPVCEQYGAAFLDAQSVAQPSEIDHIHMAPDSHRRLTEAVKDAVEELMAK
ncbi:MAG: SGNH/GDSL hydrolase family protein [Clostridia bacterium]|nr:SGNH/GDSL hydrolase family protein [Clostridia bacterium]